MKSKVGTNLIMIASLYMMVSLVMGIVMGISQNHSLATVHSHASLLGWLTMGMTGVVYIVKPRCANSGLAKAHAWLHNLGLPVMMVSLGLSKSGNAAADKFIGLGSVVVLVALLLFTVNVVKNGNAE